MTRLLIRHETRYRYERPVSFGPQRLMLRPRDSHGLRVEETYLGLSPHGSARWTYDALGNCVCWFQPAGESGEMIVSSELIIERFPAPLAAFHPQDPHSATPIVYARDDRLTLAPFMTPDSNDDADLTRWLLDMMDQPGEPALDFLLRFNAAIHGGFAYRARDEEGVQDPAQTLRLGSGSCRDLAWLMVEALRRAGYAARFVTGYLNSPATGGLRGAGATHAWCEVFLPDLGWTEFDPTNGLAESANLIPVAVARSPREASPISGTIRGDPGHCTLEVRVEVGEAAAPSPSAAEVAT